ncbi:MAG: hypothetical protein ACP6IS_04115 [Candidatus Asgardarchaeia archaeon]
MLKVQRTKKGILLNFGKVKVGLDDSSAEINLISHAHADHISGKNESKIVLASKETIELYQVRKKTRIKRFITIKERETIELNGLYITALNAGHVLGSFQFLIENANYSILYTGDFNVENSIIYRGAKPVETDVLIVDSTYGKPEYVFPQRKELYSRMITEALKALAQGFIPVFQGYSLGKAQEAIAVFQRLKIPIYVGDMMTDQINKIYKQYGIDLKYQNILKADLDILMNGEAVLITANTGVLKERLRAIFRNESEEIIGRLKIFPLTGWSIKRHRGIPLSGHTDFPRLLEFIERTRAKKVFTFTSNGVFLSKFLRTKGLDAEHI